MEWVILFFSSIILGGFSGYIGKKLSILDNPNNVKIHSFPIPRTGGVGIFLSFILGIYLFKSTLDISFMEFFFLSIIFLIGFIDDLISILPKIKFFLEIVLSILLSMFNPGKFIPFSLLNILFSVFYLVGSINALNEIDGMDGLAGGIAFISCLFLSYWFKELSLIVAIACLGFLIWNFYPAKVFMGDGGSLFLGAFIGLMSLKALNMNPSFSTLIFLIFLYIVPIYDSALTIIRRIINKKSIFKPDLGHFYNKLYNLMKNYVFTVILIYIFAITFGVLGFFLKDLPGFSSITIGLIIWFLLIFIGYKLGFMKE
ncbi:MAG: MraY family glycosyltransferase [Elusimicrobiota bacterium]|nr:undecaprenyl/decaprenyl-phosphate alpha-N-acetylglucosaminyl 1-phosphate transferase [Endomicrobiia bacterium]MDW8166186.1 MraY family glycosyltransferase [Elusimicrobiota bacterium]